MPGVAMAQCRICLQSADQALGEFIKPCRCKEPVHRKCLDTWRASGINPANITRCEVCQYHYRLGRDARPRHVHMFVYSIALVQILLFLALSVAAGFMIRATKLADLVNWGRLSFMVPDTDRGWIFLGCCFNFFCIGVFATAVLLYRLIRRRRSPARQAALQASSRRSTWLDDALRTRNRRQDCCGDCCYTTDDSLCLWCYYCCSGPNWYCPLEGCCYNCDIGTARCFDACECCKGSGGGGGGCDCCDCGSCGCDGDAGIFAVILGAIAAAVAIILLAIGMFVFFWVIFYNVFNGIFMNHSFLHSVAAERYHVLPYDVAYDTSIRKTATPESAWPLEPVTPPIQQGMNDEENARVVGKVEAETIA